MYIYIFFFFKQKTAYEIVDCDWSSDVCSSDLYHHAVDAILLEPHTDGMVIVTRPGITRKPILTNMLEQLEEKEDIRVLGTVINGANMPVAVAQMRDDSLSLEEPLSVNGAATPGSDPRPVRTPIEF